MLPFLLPAILAHSQAVDVAAAYRRADTVNRDAAARVAMLRLEPNWIDDGSFWYRKDEIGGSSEYIRVDARTGAKTPLFDAPRLAAALVKETGKTVDPLRLSLRGLRFVDGAIRSRRKEAAGSLTRRRTA